MKRFFLMVFSIMILGVWAGESWVIRNMPGEYENPGIIKVVPGETQALTFYFLAPPEVLNARSVGTKDLQAAVGNRYEYKTKNMHNLKVEITLPEGMEFIDSIAGAHPTEKHKRTINGRHVIDDYVCYKTVIPPLNSRVSESATWKMAVKVSEKASMAPAKLTLALSYEGKPAAKKEWIIQRVRKFTPAPELKYLKLGLWDYGHYLLEKATPGIVDFWKHAGINCFWVKISGCEPENFTVYNSYGSYLDYFINWRYPNFDAKGKPRRIHLNGWYLRQKPINEILPGIAGKMLDPKIISGTEWAGLDYEPTGVEEGFIPESMENFKKEYNVSEADAEKLFQGLKKHGFSYHSKAGNAEKEIYHKWNEYQTRLSGEFLRNLIAELRKINPKLKFHTTVLNALPPPDGKGAALGIDGSWQAKYLDMIEPQIYVVGKEIAVKYAIIHARKWYERVKSLNPDCAVHPLLVVRYAGTKERNSAVHLRQQTIGCIAEGSVGVSYYFTQGFNAGDWGEIAKTVRILVPVEKFYVQGVRCDEEFKVSGAPERVAHQILWPHLKIPVQNPDWHLTAHRLKDEVLVTFFNIGSKPLKVTISSRHQLKKISHGKVNHDGTISIAPGKTAFIIYR